jgi:AhpD family alkylhydroperoxidase
MYGARETKHLQFRDYVQPSQLVAWEYLGRCCHPALGPTEEELVQYHDSDDLKKLAELNQLAPVEFSTFVAFDKTVGRDDGAIPRKYRELIALGVALTTQCPYCLDVHTRAAKRAGATREEVSETAMLAAALRAGAAVTHGTLALKLFDAAPAPKGSGAEPQK